MPLMSAQRARQEPEHGTHLRASKPPMPLMSAQRARQEPEHGTY
jgi:hypothetical protein